MITRIRIFLLLLLLILFSGCSKKHNLQVEDINSFMDNEANPFDINSDKSDANLDSVNLGMISHGFVEFQNNESTERIISYNGGELQLDYFVYAEGIAKNCGFLIYIDGVPQPYKIKELNEDYQYLHTLALEEGEEFEFSFLFIPVTGKKDDILSISIVSIIDPLFMPDMEETTSYGYRHGILEASYQIKFEQDTEEILEQDLIQHSVLKDITVSNVPMTDIDQENFKSGFKIEDSLSDDKVYTRLYIDNKDMKLESSYDISNKNNIRLRFEMTGFPGLKYKNTLYFNHKPICELRNNFFEFDLQKGFKWVLDAELDVTMLEEKGSFYIVSVPVNKGNFPNSPVSVFKTRTIFFYDSSKLNIEYENEGAKIRSARQDKTNPNLGGIDPSSVDEIYYVGDDKLCILSDKFYFYSIEDDSLLASLERNPDASYFDIRKIDNGYVIIGETGAPYKDDVYNFETGQRELIDAFHLGCTFYNENLVEIETVDIIKEIELDLIHHPAHIAVSGDGDLIACISNNNLYVYDRIRKKITLIFDQLSIADSAVNEIIFTNISFVNNNKIIFLAHCSDENNQVYPAYGMVNADGSDFYLHRGAAFDKLVSYDDFSIMSQKDSLVGLIGEVWSFYHSKNKTVKLKLNDKVESEHVWGSNTGKYFATSVRLKDQGWKIRIYDIQTAECVHEKLYIDDKADLYKDPYIYLIDQNKSIILLFRTADDSLTNKLLMDNFK